MRLVSDAEAGLGDEPVTTAECTATVVEREALGRWACQWDALGDLAPLASPFLRSWWLEGVRGPHARYLLVLHGERLIGGLALERRRGAIGVERYAALGAGKLCPDHLDLLAHPAFVPTVTAVLRAWFAQPGSRILDLEGLAEDSLIASCFEGGHLTSVDVSPYEPLPSTYEDYLARRSRTGRRHLRRVARDLEAQGVSCQIRPASRIDETLDAFWELQARRADRAELIAERPRLDRAVRAGARAGEAVTYVAELDGEVIAVELEFVVGGRACAYQQARRTDAAATHVGTRLTSHAIEDFCRRGYRELDLLRGAEPYKSSLTSHQRAVQRFVLAHGRRARALVLIDRARTRISATLARGYRALRSV